MHRIGFCNEPLYRCMVQCTIEGFYPQFLTLCPTWRQECSFCDFSLCRSNNKVTFTEIPYLQEHPCLSNMLVRKLFCWRVQFLLSLAPQVHLTDETVCESALILGGQVFNQLENS
jgi:hypothetical protein